MAKVLYYLVLLPLSRLPLGVLYALGRGLYFIGYRLFGYRTAVVRSNMRAAFPEWPEERVREEVGKFYRYFFDSLAESVKLFSMSVEDSIRRCRVANPELLEPYAVAGRSVMVVGAHYANWEIAALSFPRIFRLQTVMAIYSPLKNEAMDGLVKGNRQRTGLYLVSRRAVDEYYRDNPVRPSIDIFIADQSPSNAVWQKVHWTTFLNQPTGFLAGPERYAVRHDIPVFYMNLRMLGRGRYESRLIPIATEPTATREGEITERYARILEREIQRDPTPWLWTHRRWKREVPAEVARRLPSEGWIGPEYDRAPKIDIPAG